MACRGSTASLSFDLQDHILVGRMEGIDAIITFHADAVKEFEHHFHAVVDDAFAKGCTPSSQAAETYPKTFPGTCMGVQAGLSC